MYYKVAVLPARPRKPKDKPKVENGIQNVERWVLAPLRKRTFFSLTDLNLAIQPLLKALNERTMQHLGKSRQELFIELDQPALQPLPERPYEFAEWKMVRVNIDYHMAFDKHYYSVPYTLLRLQVEVRATERMVEIFYQGEQVAIHPRSRKQGGFTTCRAHMPSKHRFVAEVTSEYLPRQGQAISPVTARLIRAILSSRHCPEQAYRTFLGVLSLSSKYPLSIVEQACLRALQGKLHADLGRATSVKLPKEETDRRWKLTTPQWPIMHAVLHGVTRDQMMARHKAIHINVVYAPSAEAADKALAAKAAMFAGMGIEVHLCGKVSVG